MDVQQLADTLSKPCTEFSKAGKTSSQELFERLVCLEQIRVFSQDVCEIKKGTRTMNFALYIIDLENKSAIKMCSYRQYGHFMNFIEKKQKHLLGHNDASEYIVEVQVEDCPSPSYAFTIASLTIGHMELGLKEYGRYRF
jgi:hypothetical protein